MKRHGRFINNRGISLITAVIALVLLAYGILAVGEVFLRSIENNGDASGVSMLSNLAMETAERIMMLPDDQTADTTGIMSASGSSINAFEVFSYPHEDRLKILYSIVITANSTTADTDLIRIDITARYTQHQATIMSTTPEKSEVHFTTFRYRE